jgi:hypothetical protein
VGGEGVGGVVGGVVVAVVVLGGAVALRPSTSPGGCVGRYSIVVIVQAEGVCAVPVVPQLGVLLISEVLAVERTRGFRLRVRLPVRLRLVRTRSSRRTEQILRAHKETQAACEDEERDN